MTGRTILEIVLEAFEFKLVEDHRLQDGIRTLFNLAMRPDYRIKYVHVPVATESEVEYFTYLYCPCTYKIWMCEGCADLARGGFVDISERVSGMSQKS